MLLDLKSFEKEYWAKRIRICWNILSPYIALDSPGLCIRYYYRGEMIAEEIFFDSTDTILNIYNPECIRDYLC